MGIAIYKAARMHGELPACVQLCASDVLFLCSHYLVMHNTFIPVKINISVTRYIIIREIEKVIETTNNSGT